MRKKITRVLESNDVDEVNERLKKGWHFREVFAIHGKITYILVYFEDMGEVQKIAGFASETRSQLGNAWVPEDSNGKHAESQSKTRDIN